MKSAAKSRPALKKAALKKAAIKPAVSSKLRKVVAKSRPAKAIVKKQGHRWQGEAGDQGEVRRQASEEGRCSKEEALAQ